MRIELVLAMGLIGCSATAAPQAALQAGTILPVRLDRGLDLSKVHAGEQFEATVMQDVPHSRVHRRARVAGRIVRVAGGPGTPAKIAIRFDAIEAGGRRIPLRASLRALASRMEVDEAELPEESMDRGITPETATTTQIGGEQVYRGGGPVADGIDTVGTPTAYGVLAKPRANRDRGCRGIVDDGHPQAFWVFSTDACGVYGYSDLTIAQTGRNDPTGTILLRAESADVKLRAGSGMLLRVE